MRVLFAFLGRGLAIGLVFSAARTIVALGFAGGEAPDPISTFGIETAAGIIAGFLLEFVAVRLTGSAARATLVLTAVVFVNLLAVMIEGAAFAPVAQTPSSLPLSVLLQLIIASLVGLVTVSLVHRPRSGDAPETAPKRAAVAWFGRYVGCVLVYVVLYFVVGAINFTLVTGPYYNSGAAGLVVPAPAVVLFVAVTEGALLPVALLPLLYSMPGPRRRRALIAGTSLVLLGGVVPLIVAPSLPLVVRISSAVEIAFQKFPAGVAAATLLRPED